MEHKIVKNVSQDVVTILWDGQQVEFEAGQSKVFPIDLAIAVSHEDDRLQLVDTELVEKVIVEEVKQPAVEEEVVLEPVKKSRKKK